ncbi:MAG: isochorismatase family protein [Acidobacteria bacterium]|nr:isochorismatase family protein [Acidobacteriota bacterium]
MPARADPLLNPETSVVVLIDYQPEMLALVRSMDPKLLELNVQAFARSSKKVSVPTILSTVGVGMGVNKPTIPSLRKELADQPELDRSSINAWADEGVRVAVERTGRRRVIFGALWTEICLAFPVVHAQREGYETYFVTDISGGTSRVAHDTGVQRMMQAGSVPVSLGGSSLRVDPGLEGESACEYRARGRALVLLGTRAFTEARLRQRAVWW